jgi:ubiquinone/menaquinone biosynthesis C-methylase UbiE
MLTLDVGCGYFPQGDVNVDVDIKTSFHHRGHILTREKAKKISNFVLADAEHLPFRDNSFYKSTCFHTIEHLKNPLKCLRELIRVTKCMVTVKCPHRYAPKKPSHINYFKPTWFTNALKDYIVRSTARWGPHPRIPFLPIPLEITVEINTQKREQPKTLNSKG